MENNKDFEKLEEQYKRYMDLEEFNKNSKPKIDRISKIIFWGIKSISITSILIGIAVLIFAFITIYALVYTATPKNVLKSLKELYGEEFEIIEDFGAKDAKSKGLYIVSPKNNKNIQFKMLNTTQFRNDNDYSAQRTKYYIDKCKDKKLLEGVKVDESTFTYEGIEFLQYTLYIELNDYSEIEEKTEKAYKLAKYLYSQDNKMDEPIFLDVKDMISLISVHCNTDKSLDEEINSVKYDYIQTLYVNDKKEELKKIGQDEIDKIWKPKYLQIVVNEKETTEKVEYNIEDKKYQIVNISRFLKQLDNVEILKIGMFSQEIKKIKFNDKTYKIEQGLNNGKNKDDVIYTEENVDNICKKLNCEIKYDYLNEKIYVKMK